MRKICTNALVLIFLIMIGFGIKQKHEFSIFPTMNMNMNTEKEYGVLTGVSLVRVKEEVIQEQMPQYQVANDGTQTWHEIVTGAVNDLTDGEIVLDDALRTDYAMITFCRISDDKKHIEAGGVMEKIPASDDQYIYLFALESYQTLEQVKEPVAFTLKSSNIKLSMNFDASKERNYLYDQYVLALKVDGKYCAISDKYYITNPEKIAENQSAAPVAESIKGLLLDPSTLLTPELDALSCKQIVYNIPIANLLGETSDGRYPTVYYTYRGKTYALDGYTIAGYDGMFRYLRTKDIVITAVVLNNRTEEHEELIHPLARDYDGANYYEFNTAEQDGCETIEAIASFLGERYGSEEHGLVSNWIIANEINQREQWNYISYMSIDDYVKIYESSFRIFYQAIKSHNANANVYFSIDQMWNANDGSNPSFYNGKDLLNIFNYQVIKHGNIDWGLALHPYSYPLTKVTCWTDEAGYTEDDAVVSMKNISVATDYMQREELLNPKKEVRSIILSEIGFTSTSGQELQAAAFAYCYYMASHNEYIDALLVNRMTDSEEEIKQGLAMGLRTLDGTHKQIWDLFAHIDEEDSKDHMQFALGIVGEDDWDDIIP